MHVLAAITLEQLRPDLSQLTSDGDSLELADGRTLTLRIRPDDQPATDMFGKGIVYGCAEWTRNDGDTGYSRRPDGFTGSAEILKRDGRYSLWWEPFDPSDIPGGRNGEGFRAYRTLVSEILEYGFIGLELELRETLADSRGGVHRVEIDSASLWGIEPFPDADYVSSVVADLWSELEHNARTAREDS